MGKKNRSKGVTWNTIPPDAAVHLAAAARSSVSCFNLQLELSQGKGLRDDLLLGRNQTFSARDAADEVSRRMERRCAGESGSTFIHIRTTTTTPNNTCDKWQQRSMERREQSRGEWPKQIGRRRSAAAGVSWPLCLPSALSGSHA